MQTYSLVVHYKSGSAYTGVNLSQENVFAELTERMADEAVHGNVESWTIVPEARS